VTTLRPLTRWDGETVYVNPAQVVFVEEWVPGGEGPRSRITFAFAFSAGGDDLPLTEQFRGLPGEIADLLRSPLGPAPGWTDADIYKPERVR